VDFCGTHVQERSKFHSKAFKYKYGIQFLNFFKLQYGAMGYLLDGGSNEKKCKYSCTLHSWGFMSLLL